MPELKTIAIGTRFGRLVAIEETRRGKKNELAYICKCDCGNERIVFAGNLRRGLSSSCGCYVSKILKPRRTHGQSRKSITYKSWTEMRGRCFNPDNAAWANYGGRGITVCERWREFENFLEDMGECPSGFTLDRYPNNDGNYEPGNCRWATYRQQNRNRRDNRIITHNGQQKCLAEWAELLNLNYEMLKSRLNRGWPIERAMVR